MRRTRLLLASSIAMLFCSSLAMAYVYSAAGISAYYSFTPFDTVLPLFNLTKAFLLSPNRTIIGVYVVAEQTSENLVYGTFEVGVDGWRYVENDSNNILYWVWVNASGYSDWGYTGFVAVNIPSQSPGTVYGYQIMFVNFTTPSDMVNASLSLAYYFWNSQILLLYPAVLIVGIHDWSTGNTTTVYQGSLSLTQGLSALPSSSSSWRTLSINLTSYLLPGHEYALLLGVVWYEQLLSYNATLFFDDVNLTVFRASEVYAGNIVKANYSYNSTLSVSLRLVSMKCFNSSAQIKLITGLESSTPINVTNCTVISNQTSSVTVSNYTLQNTLYIWMDYNSSSGGFMNASLELVIASPGHVVIERVYVNASAK